MILIAIFLTALLCSFDKAHAQTYVTLYESTGMVSGNKNNKYPGINTLKYNTVRMSYTVDLSSAFAGYSVMGLNGKWYSRCGGAEIRYGHNGNNNGAPRRYRILG